MKHLLALSISLLFVTGAFAQTCKAYYPHTEGQTWTLSYFDKKGKPAGSTAYEVVSISDNGEEIKASYKSTVSIPKSDDIVSEFSSTCTADGIEIDMAAVYAGAFTASYTDMEVDIESDVFAIPPRAQAGDELEDINLTIKAGMSGINMTTSVDHIDRKVIGRETITTDAGTFDCIKITYTQRAKIVMANRVEQITEWHAIGIGLVKSEAYKKGKLTGTVLLTQFNQ